MFSRCVDCTHSRLDVSRVIQRVEYPEDIHPMFGGHGHKRFHHIVGKIGVLDDVLTAQQHHVGRFGCALLDRVETVKREFVQEAQARIDGGSTPRFQRAKTEVVE